MLLPTALRNCRYTKCCLLLSDGTFHRSGLKFPIGSFTGVAFMNFIPDRDSEN